jgi:hypothetical protein
MQETTQKTMPELCEEWGIELELRRVKAPKGASAWQKSADAWLAILSRDGYHLAVPYYTGKAVKETTVADVVHSLASDHNIYESTGSLKNFGDEFGWDEDTASTWEAVSRNAHAWEEFIGDAYLLQTLGECEY